MAAPSSADPLRGTRKGSVKWLAMEQIVRTGIEAGHGTQFARYADKREIQGQFPCQVYDVTRDPFATDADATKDYVLDYVADTGDGFRATYAVARSLTGTVGSADAPAGKAQLLVMGGDEVYPVASMEAYNNRLALPFEEAQRQTDQEDGGWVVALPGNHDWYDSLVAFRRNFCESWVNDARGPGQPQPVVPDEYTADQMLGRYAFQSRSYFAVKLPHGWWLWGLDIQLDSHVDVIQLDYFRKARAFLEDHERVILCTARPAWTDSEKLDNDSWTSNRQVLTWFVNRMFGNDDVRANQDRVDVVRLVLSGDKHHYVRYERTPDANTAPEHLVTCGGGGAFLSSTHHEKSDLEVPWHLSTETGDQTGYHRVKEYPSAKRSRWGLSLQFLRIPVVNGPVTPGLVALVDLALALCFLYGLVSPRSLPWLPLAVGTFLVASILVGLSMAFRPRWLGKLVGIVPGLVHTALHGVLVFLVVCVLPGVLGNQSLRDETSFRALWGDVHTETYVVGGIALVLGSWLVFALYFLLCDWVHWHENEFFAGMRIQGYKSHLRLTIKPPAPEAVSAAGGPVAGTIELVAYGIEKTPWPRWFGWFGARPADPSIARIDSLTVEPNLVNPDSAPGLVPRPPAFA